MLFLKLRNLKDNPILFWSLKNLDVAYQISELKWAIHNRLPRESII